MAEPRMEFVKLTPHKAEQLLEGNTHNRLVKANRVDQIARDIDSGNWIPTGNAISIASDGSVVDGQHRLLAIVAAGKTVQTWIQWDTDPRSQSVTDTGAARSYYDVLKLAGEENYTSLAAVVRAVSDWKNGGFKRHGGSSRRPTTKELDALLEESPWLRDAAVWSGKLSVSCRVPARVVGISYYLFHQVDPEATATFFRKWDTGAGLDEGDPILALRRRFIERQFDTTKRSRQWWVAITILAWNKWRAGRLIKRLNWNEDTEMPEPR